MNSFEVTSGWRLLGNNVRFQLIKNYLKITFYELFKQNTFRSNTKSTEEEIMRNEKCTKVKEVNENKLREK